MAKQAWYEARSTEASLAWYQTGSVRASLREEVKMVLRQHIAGGWDGTTTTSLLMRRYVLKLPPLPGAPYTDFDQIDPFFTQKMYDAVKRVRRSVRLEQREAVDDARLQHLMQVVKKAMEATVPGESDESWARTCTRS
jgi:hypothetical protein